MLLQYRTACLASRGKNEEYSKKTLHAAIEKEGSELEATAAYVNTGASQACVVNCDRSYSQCWWADVWGVIRVT